MRGTNFVVGVAVGAVAGLLGAGCTAGSGGEDPGADEGLTALDDGAGDGDSGTDAGETGSDAGDEADGGTRFDVGDDGGDADDGADDGAVDPECGGLEATIRDFKSTHPDFEVYWGEAAYTGLVLADLGADQKPQYNPSPSPPPGYVGADPQITSAQTFAEWYADVPGVNMREEIELVLEETAAGSGVFVFDDDYFFPVDGLGFNDETFPDENLDPHNFHFTTEMHTRFEYAPGQSFTFKGDDDLWLFIDGELVIDLGGLHGALTETVDLDTLGLTAGETYDMDIFHAERRHDGSHFRIETTIDCFTPPPAG